MLDLLENLLERDLDYHYFMDWSCTHTDNSNVQYYQDPKNKHRVIMYQKFNGTMESQNQHGQTVEWIYESERIQYYYGAKMSRANAPCFVEKKKFIWTDKRHILTSYTANWSTRGFISRKNKPAEYMFNVMEENGDMNVLVMNWMSKPVLKTQGSYHRLNGPAKTCFEKIKHKHLGYIKGPEIQFYIHGKKYSEYDYWKRVLSKHKNKMPKMVFEDDKKIVFGPSVNKPGPKILYKNVKRCVYEFEGKRMKCLEYYKNVDVQNAISKKWLTV